MSDSKSKLPFGAASAYADAMEAGKANMTISCELVVEMVDALEQSHQENERLRKANQDCVAWEKACKADLDRALARVAELAKFVGAGDRLCYELEQWLAAEHDKESVRAINIWKRLRKQADQLESTHD